MIQHWPDITNSIFEGGSGLIMLFNIRRLLQDKIVHGFDWRTMIFFTSIAFWNLYYYPHLDQWFSFVAGISLVITNSIYLYLIIYYILLAKKAENKS